MSSLDGALSLVSDADEVLAELFRHGGRLLRHDRVLVHAHDQGLSGFDAVASAGALLGAHDLVRGGEVHVLRVGDHQPRLRQLVRAAVLGQQRLQLVHGNRESGGLRPDVPVVAADDGVLHHLGGHQLVVHVRLPRHLAAAAARKVEAKTGWTIEAAVEDGGGRGDGG